MASVDSPLPSPGAPPPSSLDVYVQRCRGTAVRVRSGGSERWTRIFTCGRCALSRGAQLYRTRNPSSHIAHIGRRDGGASSRPRVLCSGVSGARVERVYEWCSCTSMRSVAASCQRWAAALCLRVIHTTRTRCRATARSYSGLGRALQRTCLHAAITIRRPLGWKSTARRCRGRSGSRVGHRVGTGGNSPLC